MAILCMPFKSKFLLTDTYPGIEHQCQLLIADISADKIYELDRLDTLPQYDNSPLRCDLHPKWSFCGNFLCIDTMNDGVRYVSMQICLKVNKTTGA